MSPYCTNRLAPGVEFDFSHAGHDYRVVVLDHDSGHSSGPSLRPMTTPAELREVSADGSTRYPSEPRAAELAVIYAQDVATVRVNAHRGAGHGLDETAPNHGWVAFPAVTIPNSGQFDTPAEGLDTHGQVVAHGLPYRCC